MLPITYSKYSDSKNPHLMSKEFGGMPFMLYINRRLKITQLSQRVITHIYALTFEHLVERD